MSAIPVIHTLLSWKSQKLLNKSIPNHLIKIKSDLLAKALYEEQLFLNAHVDDTETKSEPHSEESVNCGSFDNHICQKRDSYSIFQQSKAAAKRSNDALSVLRIVLSHPTQFPIQTEISQLCGITSGSKLAKIKKHLKDQNLIIEHKLQIGKTYSSIWEPTDKAYNQLQIPKPQYHSKGGYLHQFLSNRIAKRAEQEGFKSDIEYSLPNNKAVDVVLRKPNQIIFIEIAISRPLEKEVINIIKDMETDLIPDRIIVAVQNYKMRAKLEKILSENSQLRIFQEIIIVKLAGNLIFKDDLLTLNKEQ